MWSFLIAMLSFLFTDNHDKPFERQCAIKTLEEHVCLRRIYGRQTCSSANCPVGYSCCPMFPGSCCLTGVTCALGPSGGVICDINCTSVDTTCSFGSCCPPGSICDDLNLSCQNVGGTSTSNSPVIGFTDRKPRVHSFFRPLHLVKILEHEPPPGVLLLAKLVRRQP